MGCQGAQKVDVETGTAAGDRDIGEVVVIIQQLVGRRGQKPNIAAGHIGVVVTIAHIQAAAIEGRAVIVVQSGPGG